MTSFLVHLKNRSGKPVDIVCSNGNREDAIRGAARYCIDFDLRFATRSPLYSVDELPADA
jgi:hypothetical protein